MIFARILLYLSLATAFLFILSGYGYQWGLWSLGFGFTILRYSAYAAIGLTVVNLGTLWVYRKSKSRPITYLIISIVMTFLVAGAAIFWQQKAQSVPPIHDITTDIENPPEFVAISRLRADAPNPPEYAGDETAAAQRESYPHISPLYLEAELQEVMDHAVKTLINREWDLVAINRKEGRIEATEKLAWFGFRDDVVLRFTEENGMTRVDMRSKSRIGRGDVGVNAKRIEKFLNDLKRDF